MNAKRRPRIIATQSAADLARASAEFFHLTAAESIARTGQFRVALSGGSTPRPLHRLLAAPPYRDSVPWTQTHIFWADERLVPPDDPASNFGVASKDLLDHIPIPTDHIHPMCSSRPPGQAADDYENALASTFLSISKACPVFDLILLGIGPDGHMASILPGDRTALDTSRWVVAVKGGSPNVDRLTLTLPVLDQARHIVFLVSGSDKAGMVRIILTEETKTLPPQHLASAAGRVTWYLDQDAAHLLPRELAGKTY